MLLGLPDPDPSLFYADPHWDPDPSINTKKEENLDFYYFVRERSTELQYRI